MMSRGNSGIPRREQERTKSEAGSARGGATLKEQFRNAAKGLDAKVPDPKPKSRRRSEDDTRGGFRFYARTTARRSDDRVRAVPSRVSFVVWEHGSDQQTCARERTVSGVSDEPSDAAEIIGWYLRNGYSMTQIRAMFPAFFPEPAAAPVPAWDALDWLNLWNWNDPAGSNELYDDFHHTDHEYLFPHP